ncbi:MAG: hypothetical protein JW797_12200 [Bradymonadales bacterium]|nr:hypothetical protein [Bradymonadales bacterium]
MNTGIKTLFALTLALPLLLSACGKGKQDNQTMETLATALETYAAAHENLFPNTHLIADCLGENVGGEQTEVFHSIGFTTPPSRGRICIHPSMDRTKVAIIHIRSELDTEYPCLRIDLSSGQPVRSAIEVVNQCRPE